MLRLPNVCAVFISSPFTVFPMWLLLAMALSSSEAKDLTITPKTAQKSQFENITITCKSNSVLDNCQFEVSLKEMDGTTWSLPLSHPESKNYRLFDYKYHEGGLDKGQCALTMSNLTSGNYFVGCRVKNDSSGWTYAYMAFVVYPGSIKNKYEQNQPTDFKKEAVGLNMKSSDIKFSTSALITGCTMYFPGRTDSKTKTVRLNKNQISCNNEGHSARYEAKACFASLNVTQNTNGIVWCLFTTSKEGQKGYKSFDLAIIQRVVQPRTPLLTTSKRTYKVGQNLTATCVVENARPVARIVWLLGDDVVRNDTDDDDVDRAWSWPWDVMSISQVLTRKLTAEDDGKNLTCKVFHQLYRITGGEKTFNTTVRVQNASSSTDLQITPVKSRTPLNGNITIKCQSTRPLSNCNFKVWIHGRFKKIITELIDSKNPSFNIDLSNDTNQFKKNDFIIRGNYDESDLKSGRCSLQLSMVPQGRYFVGCRARGAQGGWSYDFMTFISSIKQESNDQTSPTRINAGENLTESFQTKRNITSCIWSLPWEMGSNYEPPLNSSHCAANTMKIPGNGIQNGIIWLVANTTEGFYAFNPVILLVAEAPKTLNLKKSMDGQTLTATCVVEDARPVARIVWMLGDVVVRNDTDDDDINRAWSWPWNLTSITQVLTRKLTAEDDGKNLTCQVFHPNTSVRWRSESVLLVAQTAESITGTVVIVVMVMLLLTVGAVIVIVWLRRKRAVAAPIEVAARRNTILEENDLYQPCPTLRSGDTSTAGARVSIFTENPYEEVNLPVRAPVGTVQYEEVEIAPPMSENIPVTCGVQYSRVVVQ